MYFLGKKALFNDLRSAFPMHPGPSKEIFAAFECWRNIFLPSFPKNHFSSNGDHLDDLGPLCSRASSAFSAWRILKAPGT